jgi:Vps23 core domain/UEV domain
LISKYLIICSLVSIIPSERQDGSTATLICLAGTVPTTYRNVVYHTPVSSKYATAISLEGEYRHILSHKLQTHSFGYSPLAVYLPENYPGYPPSIYLTPSQDMFIVQPHQNVDASGLVYMPYLSEWRPTRSNLVDMIGALLSTFDASGPPLRSRGPGPQSGASPAVGATNAGRNIESTKASPASSFVGGAALTSTSSATSMPTRSAKIAQLTTLLQKALFEEMSKERDNVDELAEKVTELKERNKLATSTITSMQMSLSSLGDALVAAKERKEKIDAWLKTLNSSSSDSSPLQESKIEDVVVPSTKLTEQLLNATAEDAAIEDIYGSIDEALRQGKIDLETSIATVRALARKQFYARALAKKINAALAR